MTNERAITIIDDVNAYLASRSIYENDSIAGYTYRVICEALTQLKQSALKSSIHIPSNATNGDVIKAVFPTINFYDMSYTVHATAKVEIDGVKGGISYDFWKEWWNSPYREGDEE